ncbi:uncharacterized protein [Macrobrachium rosenbergii]|uniref:uncharacterized protein n=1 Tax=Macrobrachium rosenbergii TaxID=79674 RepID=UPI0034D746C2
MHPKNFRYLCLGFVIVLLFQSCKSERTKSENCKVSEDEDIHDGSDRTVEVEKRYYFALGSVPLGKSYAALPDPYNCTVNQTCEVDSDCNKCFPNLEMAFHYGIDDVPYGPVCQNETRKNSSDEHEGRCACGVERCFSYSTDKKTGKRFYYCGPCGYVGASCAVRPCVHPLAECRSGFCECIEQGIFYNLAFCYIPYFGAKVIVQMFISTLIIVSLCGVLAYSYHRLSSSRRRYFRRFNSWRRSSVVRESPPEDTPPTYDDVVEKVPSYQDALEMENSTLQGNDNPAFEDDEGPPPSYEESAVHSVRPSGNRSSCGPSTHTNRVASLEDDNDQSRVRSPSDGLSINPAVSEEQPIEQPIRDALGEYRRQ